MEDVIYLMISAEDGGEAEKLGAHWDPVQLRWFIRHDQDPGPFLDWLPIEELEEEEVPELCVAPPVFVAETAVVCPGCGSKSPVIALMAQEFACDDQPGVTLLLGKATGAQVDASGAARTFGDPPYSDYGDGATPYEGDVFEDDEDDDLDGDEYGQEEGLMRFQHIKTLPPDVVSFLGRHYPFFRKQTSTLGEACFVNLCPCGEPFDDAELHAEPGVGFYLFSQEDALGVVLRELPVDPPLLLRANFGVVVPDMILKFSPREAFPADS